MPRSTSTEAYAIMVNMLRNLRLRSRLTQGELAARIRKPQAFISTVETGARRIDVIEFCVLARVLEQDPVALFDAVVRELPHDIDI